MMVKEKEEEEVEEERREYCFEKQLSHISAITMPPFCVAMKFHFLLQQINQC